MKATRICGPSGQTMLATLDWRAGEFSIVYIHRGRKGTVCKLRPGQQTFMMPEGEIYLEQDDRAEGLVNITPVRQGGIIRGESAYEIAIRNNTFEGSELEWLQSLHGAPGSDGQNGSGGLRLPAGLIIWTSGPGHPGAPPEGWLPCNGAAVGRSAYAALFATIGTHYGPGDGKTTFQLPHLMNGPGSLICSLGIGSVIGVPINACPTQSEQGNPAGHTCLTGLAGAEAAAPGIMRLLPLIKY